MQQQLEDNCRLLFDPLIERDVTAAMLVERAVEKKSFGNLALLLCKTSGKLFYCFVTDMAVLSRECNHRIDQFRYIKIQS